jgi:hypothetical protein
MSAAVRPERIQWLMKRLVLALLIAVVASAPAQARLRTIAPPGSSGVSQYDETIPTAQGSRPTNTVHPGGGTSHGSGGGGGGGGGSTGTGGGGSISSSTEHALAAKGPAGAAAAARAEATAPGGSRRAASRAGSATGSPVSTASGTSASSPVSAVLKAVTGSNSSDGLVPVLPVILICSLLGATVLGLLRRRRMS